MCTTHMRTGSITTTVILVVLLISCQPVEPQPTPTYTPTPTSTPTPVAMVLVVKSTPIQVQLSEWSETVANCRGDGTPIVIYAPTVVPTPEIQGVDIAIDSTGWVDIPYIGKVDLGAQIAREHELEYGAALSTPIPIPIEPPPGTSSEIVLNLSAQVSTGYVLVSSLDSDREQRYDYRFPTRLLFSPIRETPVDCPPTPVPTPAPTATPLSPRLLELPWGDNFETQTINDVWRVVDGEGLVENGRLVSDGRGVTMVAGNTAWTDYIVQLDVSPTTQGLANQHALTSFMVRVQNLDNFAQFVIDCNTGAWWELVQNGRVQAQSSLTQVSCDDMHLELHTIGDEYEAYIDGQLVSGFRSDVFASGFFGLSLGSFAFEGGGFSVDNVMVTRPEE